MIYSKNILNYNENSKKQYPYIKFLMIQRKDTMGYTDFVRGKYPDDIIKLKEVLSIFIKEYGELAELVDLLVHI